MSILPSSGAEQSDIPPAESPNRTQGLHVRFLSQNRPGPRMGMGHYERLLIKSLISISAAQAGWCFDIRFAGRNTNTALGGVREQGLSAATYEGYSPARLARLPWRMARAAISLSHRLPLPDLFHSLSLAYPAPTKLPAVYTIHDLPPARFSDEGGLPSWAKQAAGAASAILTPSHFAKRELVELLALPEERVHVVPNGYERDVFSPDVIPMDAASLADRGIPGPFLLYTGGFTRRKNVRALLEAWKLTASRYPGLSLVLAGPLGPLNALLAHTPAPRVVAAGYLERDVLPQILKAATALVYPSIYEGFGLPPLEAMALGVPVIAVRAGAVPEVTGSCAVLASDGSAESLAHAMQSLLDSPELDASLRQRGPEQANLFSWDEHAQSVLNIYQDAAGK